MGFTEQRFLWFDILQGSAVTRWRRRMPFNPNKNPMPCPWFCIMQLPEKPGLLHNDKIDDVLHFFRTVSNFELELFFFPPVVDF